MKVFRGNWLRLLLTLLIVCAWNELISSKLDSSKRFPSRRRGPPLDKYGDIEESRGFLDDSRGSRSDDPRDYYTEDSRISRRSESDDYRLDDDFEPTMSAPDDVVQQYTSKLSSAILVSICSGEFCRQHIVMRDIAGTSLWSSLKIDNENTHPPISWSILQGFARAYWLHFL